LVDVPDMGFEYKTNGKGEICFRGPNVFRGYWADKAKTEETIDKDGWLHSGDVGIWLENGTLKIVDRKKSIFKLAQGEYVAPEKIENTYTQQGLVSQCFVYGKSTQASLVGILNVNEKHFAQWASEQGHKGDVSALINDAEVVKAVIAELNKFGKQHGLQVFEQVRVAVLVNEQWTLENDLLTPTFKQKRAAIEAKYKSELAKLCQQIEQFERDESKKAQK